MQTVQTQSVETACWSCGSPLAGGKPVCGACGKVQPLAASANYFDVFSLPKKLNIDLKKLELEFYRLSRKLHPDMYARALEQEKQWSLEQSSLLNDAYRTLKDPIARTEYLLKLQGVAIGDDNAAKKPQPPADLLEEVFDLNMQLEEIRMGDDDPQLRGDLERAKQQFEAQFADANTRLETLWTKWDNALDANDDAAQAASRDEMAALLDRRRYVRNLVRDVNEALGV